MSSKNINSKIKFKILNNELLSLGSFEIKNVKKKFYLKTFFSTRLKNKEKKIIFSHFINLILSNVEIDNLFVNKNNFLLKLEIKGIKKNINGNLINIKKLSNNKKKILTAGPSIRKKKILCL